MSALIAAQIGQDAEERIRDAFDGIPETRYRRVFFDPLQTLQRWMGHRSITSTYAYLANVQEVRDFHARSVQQVFEVFASDLRAGLARREAAR